MFEKNRTFGVIISAVRLSTIQNNITMLYSATEFEHIYTSCFPASMRLAVSLLHDEDEARDVVHEVFLRLWESGIRVDNPQAFVIRATRNSCINRINSLDTREKICRRMMLEPPPDDFDHEQRGEEMLKAVSELSPGVNAKWWIASTPTE